MADLNERLGRLLRIEREKARLSQAGLALRAGMRQQHVSRFETGRFAPTTTVVGRLFAALGWQLRMELEPVDAAFDAEIARAAAQTDEDVEMTVAGFYALLRKARKLRYLLDGELAARLHGVPVPVRDSYHVAIAEADLGRLAKWILAVPNCRRYNAKWRDFSGFDIDPKRPGPLRWRTPYGELSVRLLPSLPAPVTVVVGKRTVPLRALGDIERDDPVVARALRRISRAVP